MTNAWTRISRLLLSIVTAVSHFPFCSESVALLVVHPSDQQSTNDRKVAGSRATKVVCITVLTGNRMEWTARCGRPSLLLPSCRKLEFRLLALMDSDLAWVNGKSGRQSWCHADAFQRSIISEAIYHLPSFACPFCICFSEITLSQFHISQITHCIML